MLAKLVEWFFMLFLRKKANDKYLSKYSGRKRYVKC